MRTLILSSRETYDDVIVFQELNSFGDQLLTFRKEHQDGRMEYWTDSYSEGNWVEFTEKNMRKIYQLLSGYFF